MKKLKVGFVKAKNGEEIPMLFSNGAVLYWAHKTESQVSDLMTGQEMSVYQQIWLFYAGMKHGYEHLGKRCPYTFDDFSENMDVDGEFITAMMDEFKEQMFAKARSMGVDITSLETEMGVEPEAQGKKKVAQSGKGKKKAS